MSRSFTRALAGFACAVLASAVLPGIARPGWDYVLVGRPGATVVHDFAAMKVDLARALRTLHRKAGGG